MPWIKVISRAAFPAEQPLHSDPSGCCFWETHHISTQRRRAQWSAKNLEKLSFGMRVSAFANAYCFAHHTHSMREVKKVDTNTWRIYDRP